MTIQIDNPTTTTFTFRALFDWIGEGQSDASLVDKTYETALEQARADVLRASKTDLPAAARKMLANTLKCDAGF